MGNSRLGFINWQLIFYIIALLTATNCQHNVSQELLVISGRQALIPCNVSIPDYEIAISLIMWFKEESETPVYTMDARKGNLRNAVHFVGDQLRPRATFDLSTQPPLLRIDPVKDSDSGVYRCRVDFRWSRTIYHEVKLKVIIPPRRVFIVDQDEETVESSIERLQEGDTIALTCVSVGGKPLPNVTWWKNSKLFDDSSNIVSRDKIRNELVIQSLQRKDDSSSLTCKSSNSNLTLPASSTVIVKMILKPLFVKIISPHHPLSAGQRTQLQCHSYGSKPAAHISWWQGNKELTTSAITAKTDNSTFSKLSFTPSVEDNGSYLSCRADNPVIPNSGLEDGRILDIHYLPQTSLTPETDADLRNLIEGDEIFLKCVTKANPALKRLEWIKDDRVLQKNQSENIVITNATLEIRSLKPKNRGRYHCAAYNDVGRAESNRITLNLKFAPICAQRKQQEFRVMRNSSVTLKCLVHANPFDLKFQWYLKSSANIEEVNGYKENMTLNTLVYTPSKDSDYGVIICQASNSIGVQQVPCVFHLLPVGKPDFLKNCVIFDQSTTGFSVHCQDGYNGGLNQTFHMEVYEVTAMEHRLLANITHDTIPVFGIQTLPSDSTFSVVLYASNNIGRSKSVILRARTASAKQELKDDSGDIEVRLLVAAIAGAVAVVIILTAAGFIISRYYRRQQSQFSGQVEEPHRDELFPLQEVSQLSIPVSTVRTITGFREMVPVVEEVTLLRQTTEADITQTEQRP
ncbi:hemicentin-2-like isoform X1 [Limulus polyphemus]|uniref:Hemicentin-2-like isoform X1 n=1 Tax=Limulus polyphemus TaxID=6850 RepID=A0ABM1T1N6_LIMPO|nr:hemicentin-2-like isoform X1 [Limulus polyphemus]XP_022249792.1 hemicentin-2-like isoform X1 [Limulus polyphemus]